MGISSVPLISSILELGGRSVSALVLAAICWVLACLFTGGSYFWVMRTMKKKAH